jgi:hypothetical protein
MLEIKTATKAKMLNVIVLSQKNRKPDDDPGAKLSIELTLAGAAMAHFSQRMPDIFFEAAKAPPKQGNLPGVEAKRTLTEFGVKVKKIEWDHEMTGYTFEIVLGTGRAASNIKITDAVLSGWRLMPKEGETFVARFNLESGDVSADTFGRLAKLKSRDMEITLSPPVITQQDLDQQQKRGSIPPAPARKPGPAEKAAVAKVKGAGALPKPEPHKGDAKPARTARGKAATAKALAEGAAAKPEGQGDGAWPFPKDPAPGGAPPQSVTIEKVRGAQAEKATAAFVASSQAKH